MSQRERSAKRRAKAWWEEEDSQRPLFRYRRLWTLSVSATCFVALVPLLVLFAVSYQQYEQLFRSVFKHPIHLTVSNRSRALESYLEERLAALQYIVNEHGYDTLTDQARLGRVLANVRKSFTGFVDLGVIDASGIQRAYVGPYELQGKNYSDQSWFTETVRSRVHVGDAYMGYRQVPHFALAVRGEVDGGAPYVLRATMDADTLAEVNAIPDQRSRLDAFVINSDGVLQTPSQTYGEILSEVSLPVPPKAEHTVVEEARDGDGRHLMMGYRYVEGTSFVFVVVQPYERLLSPWVGLRTKLIGFLAASVVLIVIVILAGGTYMVRRVREADDIRLEVLHKMEYTSKMASIGRLASGVAHEINNPLAIINEKAGLLHDYVTFTEDFPRRDEFLRHIEPIPKSVERCARITHRLLRFAKGADVKIQKVEIEPLLREVLGFLERECAHRNVTIAFDVTDDVPAIESDAGRLQQVFLNIFNNALGAVEDGGRIDVTVARDGRQGVKVVIRDNGKGMSRETLEHIFEPFYTSDKQHGTGLGLSITFGIVIMLGGSIAADSEEGEWTQFTVSLPLELERREGVNGRA